MRNVLMMLFLFLSWGASWYWANALGGRSAWICFYGLSFLLLYIGAGAVGLMRPVRVERTKEPIRCWSGEALELKLRLRYGAMVMPLGWLLVEERWMNTGTGEMIVVRDTVRLQLNGTGEAVLRLPGMPRGLYRLEESGVGIIDAFGLLRIRRRSIQTGQHRILVLPRPLQLQTAAIGAGEELPPAGPQPRLQRQAASTLAYGTRPYAPGDPLNRIHWRSTARAGALRAKETEQPGSDRLLICLDAAKGVPNAAAFGTAVEAAAGLAQRALQLGMGVRLAATDRQGRSIEARGRERFAELLELLAQLPCDGDSPLAPAVQREALHGGRGADIAVITAQPDEQLLRVLFRLRERAVHMVYVHGGDVSPDAVKEWRRQAEAAGCRFTAVSAANRRAAGGGEGYGSEAKHAAAGA
ncbi:DUF58 domain-containing protein [Paenibacillus sp. 32352]|uniref:DUF58 domain-containing protein n=1 Tax=Paenibacillus sp. 32352 TaxID=1969111 RepID=UPI0009AE309B|nr:DUF58 domain-containing protein [Paenibacillus sp. 32352]